METLDLSGGRRYFIKTIIEETSVQNTTGSSKLCTIQFYYVPTTNQFGNNIVRCWELKNANNDSLIDKAIETALTIIGQQIGKPDSVSLMEVNRAYYFSFDTSETWFDKKYYLKLKINYPSYEVSEILTCSGEIDFASVLPDSFMTDGFYCQ
ncbi:uncharacterized protein LOC123271997 [Cotesia glomerata]|uniref:uncharacterized protein LOC123271997 n=1 Tax=Cotesia glomerata TaxID=32391 RepID=UPI001D027D3C|nr:uncharacterized protein LOC123271997 [Cotesia glomerata]